MILGGSEGIGAAFAAQAPSHGLTSCSLPGQPERWSTNASFTASVSGTARCAPTIAGERGRQQT